MPHLHEDDYDDRWDTPEPPGDDLDNPYDDGTLPLAPMQFDPLCELRGEPYPRDAAEAAGPIPEQLWRAA